MIFVFRPCYIAPRGLPADFYDANGIDCKGVEAAIYTGATGADSEEDPLCLWSVAHAFEGNPPTIYVGWNDICFDPAEGGFAPEKSFVEQLYAFVSTSAVSGVYVRLDMEKGKRTSTALQPENVDAQGNAISGVSYLPHYASICC